MAADDQIGLAAVPDVTGAGNGQWARISGYKQAGGMGTDPLFGERFLLDEHVQRIATRPAGAGGRPAMDGAGAQILDDWRDVLNWRNSPAPWILLFLLAALGLMQFRVQARAGAARGEVALG